MKYSLRTKLSLSYILVALISVTLISFLTNLMLDKQFQTYVKNNIEQRNKEVVAALTNQYQPGGQWETALIEDIGIGAMGNGLIVRLEDSLGEVIWDATVHNNGMCQRMLQQMASNLNSRYPSLKGSYVEVPYAIISDGNEVGTVYIGYYGPFYLNDNDLEFINTLNRLFIGVGIFSLIFALILGYIMARRLSIPIARVIDSAQKISKGYFHDRINEASNTKEIGQLTESVNQLAQTLETQEVLRKRLTGDVAHELRTPIATLQSHMEAMIDGIWEPELQRLESCHEEIMRIGRMVGDLEKLAQYESENLILTKTEFDISQVMKRILHNFENDYNSKKIKVDFIGKEEFIEADQDKMSQVIVNLLSNALKYTPQGGILEIAVFADESFTKITINDNGSGIPENDLPYIFERFYRADKSRNRLTGGSGIGLTIVKAIIDAHKGTILVKSELGKGTQISISIPKKSH
ncbi:MAG: two-component sensor histidine kinase [Firmicutes bacterium HGW-Firmicutes-1]|jgi:signal transduction histidine kinase|nr:MAG: two-component sensor histidine kinase [Firmicutes bacterium HGW-Firmicutes-1]